MPYTSPDTRPNVLFITVDQWRGDCLGIDGHPLLQTPTLDALAQKGVRFSQAYTATPTCVPARATLLTGMSQEQTGRIGYADGVPFCYPTTIGSEFTRAGYQTEAIGKLHIYPQRHRAGFQHVRLHDGFLHYGRAEDDDLAKNDDYLAWLRQELGANVDYFDHGLSCNGVATRPWDKPEYTHPTNWVVSEAMRFLDQRDPTAPFLLYLGFHRPHPPYDPPQWAFDLYRDAELPEPLEGDWEAMLDPYRNDADHTSSVAVRPAAVRNRALAGYLGLMTHIDHQLNRLLETMDGKGLLANTWICFTSDHGEMLGDHHLYRKSMPYDGSARVPLLIVPPPGVQAPRGSSSDVLTELRDVMPTLLDVIGVEPPADIAGRSLLPIVTQRGDGGHELIHGEHPAIGQSVQWLTDGREKYIWWSGDGREQLFDLENDPGELHDLAQDESAAPRLAFWRQQLIQRLSDREDGHVDGDRLVPGKPALAVLPSVMARWNGADTTATTPERDMR